MSARPPSGPCRALSLAAPLVGGDSCIVHAATGLLGEPLAPFLADVRSVSPDVMLIVHQSPAPPAGRLSAATRQMLHLAELDPSRAALGMTGVWLFGAGALPHMRPRGLGRGQGKPT